MMKTITKLVISLLAFLPMTLAAAPVDVSVAQETALGFISGADAGSRMKAPAMPGGLRLVYCEPSEALPQAADYYIFDADGCFVIVAGDNRAQAVLAYGDGPLDMDNLPCNLQWMLDHYEEQVEWLHAHPEARVTVPVTASTIIKPLLHCTWSQGTPYNDQCPIYKGEHCVTGCIATAMAQVMYYWRYPDELPELPAYVARFHNIYVPALPGTQLDWDSMLDGYSAYYTPEQGEAVATLMRYCGQVTSMEYGTDGSGSGSWNQMMGMQVFGYSMGAQLVHRDDYDADTWRAMMLEDLTAGYPILYTGHGESGGHAFVVDGYDGVRFSINWGWEGYGNNYFALDAFDVSGMSFSYGQEMSWHIFPPEYTGTHDFEVDGLCYRVNGSEVTVTPRLPSCNSYQGNVVIPERVTYGGVTYKVTTIGYDAFRDCNELLSITLPTTIRHIGKFAFKNCSRLSSVTLPGSVATIEYGAFQNCTSLASLSLGNGVGEIGHYAFDGCIRLNRLTVPGSVSSIGVGAFFDCLLLTTVSIGDGTSVIGDDAFAFCRNLREVTIGNGTEVIGGAAFYDCRKLEKMTLGFLVDSIGPMTFSGCQALAKLIALPELPPLVDSEYTFDPLNFTRTTLVVRGEMRENYICDDIWDKFMNIVNLEDEVIPGDVNSDSEVNIADVNAVIDAILGGSSEAAADVNGDGEVNIADVNAVINLIIK